MLVLKKKITPQTEKSLRLIVFFVIEINFSIAL